MPYPRALLVPAEAPGYYHCVSRCVRRAWLCGTSEHSGDNFDHRRDWIEARIRALANLFAVAIYGYAVMSNHYHVVLRVDPEHANKWSDDEVASRWIEVFPGAVESKNLRRQRLIEAPGRLAECRRRLGCLSWFMRCLNEPIARRANLEDDCTGRFWEGRFKSQALLDDNAVLAAMAYVDLNPIRAGMTQRLDQSAHTSVLARIESAARAPERLRDALGAICGLASAPVLSFAQADYIALVDWTGRQIRPDKTGSIPESEPSALARLGLGAKSWTTSVLGVGSGYWRAIGSVASLLERAQAMRQRWLKGIGLARQLELAGAR